MIGADIHATLDAVAALPRLVIAAVGGYALGGGCELALACDYRIASEKAVFGQPEILLGIIPGGGGTQRLTRLIGPSRPKDLVMTGRQVNAEEALRIGLCNEVVPPEQLHERALRAGGRGGQGRGAGAGAGQAGRGRPAPISRWPSALALEIELFVEVFRTEDSQIGVKSFLDHGPGKADFKGR